MEPYHNSKDKPSQHSTWSRTHQVDELGAKKKRTAARETIHPRIPQQTKNAGTLLAQSRNEKLNTFWSTVIANGLPITAALTPPDEAGMHGPWSSKQLAQSNRMLVDQLIAFQIYHGELPSVLEVIQILFPQGQLPAALVTHPPLSAESARGQVPAEIYEAAIESATIQQDITEQGFGPLTLTEDE